MVSRDPHRHELWRRMLELRRSGRPWSLTQALCDLTEHVLDIDAAAISLYLNGNRRDLAAAGSSLASILEDLQFTTGEGPGTDAVRSGGDVLVANLADLRWRWPLFLEPALRRGASAIFAFPLPSATGSPIATLTLYRLRPGPLSARDETVVPVLRDLASRVLYEDFSTLAAGDTTTTDNDVWPGHFQAAHTASGILATQHRIDVENAMVLLRARAVSSDQPLLELADHVCTHRTMPD